MGKCDEALSMLSVKINTCLYFSRIMIRIALAAFYEKNMTFKVEVLNQTFRGKDFKWFKLKLKSNSKLN